MRSLLPLQPNGLGIVMGWPAEQPPTAAPPEEAAAPPPSSGFASRRSKKATRSKSIRRPASPPTQAADAPVLSASLPSAGADSCGGQSPQERKNRIRDKLRHFFVRRPTLESLQEKGIFKVRLVWLVSDKRLFFDYLLSRVEGKNMLTLLE